MSNSSIPKRMMPFAALIFGALVTSVALSGCNQNKPATTTPTDTQQTVSKQVDWGSTGNSTITTDGTEITTTTEVASGEAPRDIIFDSPSQAPSSNLKVTAKITDVDAGKTYNITFKDPKVGGVYSTTVEGNSSYTGTSNVPFSGMRPYRPTTYYNYSAYNGPNPDIYTPDYGTHSNYYYQQYSGTVPVFSGMRPYHPTVKSCPNPDIYTPVSC